jgi:hypothetical protein
MYFKSSIHEKKGLFAGLLPLFLVLCFVGPALSSRAQTSPTNICRNYVYDSRTYGLEYNRVRIDSVLSFPFILDTVQNDTCHRPELYSLGAAQLWWFDGARNYPIASGSGTFINGTANGLSQIGSTAIEGYAGAAPNLFRSVLVKTGPVHAWGINADSLYLAGGTDTVVGPYVGVGSQSQFASGPAFQAGFKDLANNTNNYYEADSQFIGPNLNLADGANAFEEFGDRLYQVNANALGAGTYNWMWEPTVQAPALQATIPGFAEFNMADSAETTTEQVQMDSNFRCQLNVAGGGSIQLMWMDHINTVHVRRLAVDGDNAVGNPVSITVRFNPALGVASGPSGYTITGYDQAFVVTFTTGTVTGGTDSTSFAMECTFSYPAEVGFITTPQAYNSAAGIALASMQPYIVNTSMGTFDLFGALTNWSTAGFKSNTPYAIAFKTIDY